MSQNTDSKQTIRGKVTRYRIIKPNNSTLVFVEIFTQNQQYIHCLVARHALTFLMDVTVGDTIDVYGHYNQRQQFIIEKYLSNQIQANHQLSDHPAHLKYPKRKEE